MSEAARSHRSAAQGALLAHTERIGKRCNAAMRFDGQRRPTDDRLRDTSTNAVFPESPRSMSGPCLWLDELAGVHDLIRVERLLDAHHQIELDLRLVVPQFVAPQLAHAVFSADAAVGGGHDVVDDAVELRGAGREYLGGRVQRQ